MGGFGLEDFIAGWIAGVAGVVVGHPFDTLKVRQQTYSTSLFKAARITYRSEGVKGFFKGILFPIITFGPYTSIFFGVYGNVVKIPKLTQDESNNYRKELDNYKVLAYIFLSGCIAGQVQVLFWCPIEMIKTVLQAQTKSHAGWKPRYQVKYKGSIDAFWGIIRERGVRGLYKGGLPTMIRDVPTSGTYMLTYELMKYKYFAECDTPEAIKQTIAGGCAGFTCWAPVVPMDVVKSRLQADNPDNPMYKGTLDCIRKMYRDEGFRTLFKGFPAIMFRIIPLNAVTFVVYETVLSLFVKLEGLD